MTTTLILGGAASASRGHAFSALGADRPSAIVVPSRAPADLVAPADVSGLPPAWTVQDTDDVTRAILRGRTPAIVDNLDRWTAGLIERHDAWQDRPRALASVQNAADELAALWSDAPFDLVAISTEVAFAAPPAHPKQLLFLEALDRVNAIIGAASTKAVVLLGGRPINLNALPVA